jgi:hypothetical protein
MHMFALPDGEWNCTKTGDHWNSYGIISFFFFFFQYLLIFD